jgi:Txe/YoeB family toxin of toxin-antitoxin system
MYRLTYTKKALNNSKKIAKSNLRTHFLELLEAIQKDPWAPHPPFKLLKNGNYKGAYSRRVNIQHRLVYEVYEDEKIIKILSMWGHYDDN